jgi:carboxylate-amine ligase
VSEEVGLTLGVEEEYHVVDAETLELRGDDGLVAAVRAHDVVGPEVATTQVEVATDVCSTLTEVRAELTRVRSAAKELAAARNARVLVSATHPWARWEDQRLTPEARYVGLFERYHALALTQVICGCHVHVSVPDLDTAVRVTNGLRTFLPTLLALTSSSPFFEGFDTGHESWRTQWFARFPTSGVPELLADGADFEDAVAALVATGVADDGRDLYWDVRPSVRYPTVEVRVGDVMTDLDDAVLHAALVRSLARSVLVKDVPRPRTEAVRAAKWRAARSGLSEGLVGLSGSLVPARAAVGELLAFAEDDLRERGDFEEVSGLLAQVLERGTSARRQRSRFERGAGLRELTHDLLL